MWKDVEYAGGNFGSAISVAGGKEGGVPAKPRQNWVAPEVHPVYAKIGVLDPFKIANPDGDVYKMSRPLTSRLAAQSLFRSPRTTSNALKCPFQAARPLSHTSARRADDFPPPPPRAPRTRVARPSSTSLLENIYGTAQPPSAAQPAQPNAMSNLSQSLVFKTLGKSSLDSGLLGASGPRTVQAKEDDMEPFHFHIYSHKHNTHITCTKPNREPIISLSCGNIGFRKSRRGTFDSAYSLTKYVLERLIHTGWPMKISRLEVVMRGFGQGREAALKVLMSPEGKVLRDKIVRVADSTRIKFAGTRSEKPRRL